LPECRQARRFLHPIFDSAQRIKRVGSRDPLEPEKIGTPTNLRCLRAKNLPARKDGQSDGATVQLEWKIFVVL
jgi:hypothetical protein